MSLEESYLFLFFDSVMASLVLLPNTPMVFDAMRVFGGFSASIILSLAVAGNAVGSSLNYALGRIMNHVKKNVDKSEGSKKFISLKNFANKKLFALAFFSFIPLIGVVITLVSGFLRVSYLRFIAFVVLGRVFYYLLLN